MPMLATGDDGRVQPAVCAKKNARAALWKIFEKPTPTRTPRLSFVFRPGGASPNRLLGSD